MTAAVPGPRFRDQLAEDLCRRLREELDDSVLTHTGRSVGDIASWRVVEDLLAPDGAVTRLVEARVQAAANQRAVEVLRRAADTAPVMRFDNGYPVRAVPVSDLLSFAAALAQPAPGGEPT